MANGTTTANVRLRAAPSTAAATLAFLTAKTVVPVLGQEGDWLKVTANQKLGFIHKSFVLVEGPIAPPPAPIPPTPPTPPAPTPQPVAPTPGMTRDTLGDDVANVPLEAPADKRLKVNPKDQLLNRLAADIWNRYGGLISAISNILGIESAAAIAVFAVESGGKCFAPDGRMIIRFENQVFFDQWGKNNAEVFNQHFTFDPNQRWMGHKWRPTPNEAWRPADLADFHGNQGREWDAFGFARTLNDRAAKASISMGAPQIMGFNCTIIGYATPGAMFDAFVSAERPQVVGFFDFVQGTKSPSARVTALQQHDFTTFAKFYNGSGQAAKYGQLIKTTFDAFNQMKAAAGI